MQLIHDHIHEWDQSLPHVAVKADRNTLGKRRWRAAADDGADFGFDLEYPLAAGDVFHADAAAVYYIEQTPEPVLEIPLSETTAAAAKLGWTFGNLHFPIQVADGVVRVVDDPAVRQICERERFSFTACERVFIPLGSGAHGHHHHH